MGSHGGEDREGGNDDVGATKGSIGVAATLFHDGGHLSNKWIFFSFFDKTVRPYPSDINIFNRIKK